MSAKLQRHDSRAVPRWQRFFPRVEILECRTLLASLHVDINDPACDRFGPVYCEIQDAVDEAESGDVIKVATGTYTPVDIEVDDITIEEATHDADPVIEADFNSFGIYSKSSGINLIGLTVANAFPTGIFLTGDQLTLLGNTTINSGRVGYYLRGHGHLIEGNTSMDVGVWGFCFDGSSVDNVIRGNLASGSAFGFFVAGMNNTLIENTARDNSNGGFDLGESSGFPSQGNLLVGNRSIDNGGYGFGLFEGSREITLERNTATGNLWEGFVVEGSENSTLVGNTALENHRDGYLIQGEGVIVRGNTATANQQFGFSTEEADDVVFESNDCRNNLGGSDNLGGRLCLDIGDDHIVGDVNGDGRFDSSDLVAVLAAGKYESAGPANYSEGDWNDDGLFDSSDLVAALATGQYAAAARPNGTKAPEPSRSPAAVSSVDDKRDTDHGVFGE